MTDRKIIGIQKVTVGANPEPNVLDMEITLMSGDSEDLAEVQFTPNTIEGIGFKQYDKWWKIRVVHDSWTDVWDTYIKDDAKGSAFNFSVTFDIITAGVLGTELWTFEAGKSYILNRDALKVELQQERNPGAVEVACIGTVAITQP